MNQDEKVLIYNKGFKAGKEHQLPSPDTKKFMENVDNQVKDLQINMAEITKDISYIKQGLSKNDEQHKEILGKIDGFVQSADDRFAAKKDHKDTMAKIDSLENTIDSRFVTKDEFGPIKKVVYGLIGAILLAFMGAVVALVFK